MPAVRERHVNLISHSLSKKNTFKQKCHLFDKISITGYTSVIKMAAFPYNHLQKFHQIDNISVSVQHWSSLFIFQGYHRQESGYQSIDQ